MLFTVRVHTGSAFYISFYWYILWSVQIAVVVKILSNIYVVIILYLLTIVTQEND